MILTFAHLNTQEPHTMTIMIKPNKMEPEIKVLKIKKKHFYPFKFHMYLLQLSRMILPGCSALTKIASRHEYNFGNALLRFNRWNIAQICSAPNNSH